MKSTTVPMGRGSIIITSEEFLNGFNAGKLTHKNDDYAAPAATDRHLTSLLMEKLEDVDHTELYNFGYLVGWLATLANREQGGQPHDV